MKKTVKLIVTGLVQGVSLRYYTDQEAQRRKLNGYIRNLPTGAVEIVAVGEEEELKDFIVWLKTNPGASQIERNEETWSTKTDKYQDFTIQY